MSFDSAFQPPEKDGSPPGADSPAPSDPTVPLSTGPPGGWTAPNLEEAARLFPQYEVLALLGRGGMGAVYQARQLALDRLVAIKLLPLEISTSGDFADRFTREARTMGKLNHPNIIAVYDFGTTTAGHLYFAMEYVEGMNLHEIIHGPGLAPAQALSIIGEICEALAYAHSKGVVHRDIKPANVMITTEGRVKVADFGLARLTDPAAEALGHTMTGTVMGTPDYMAPEQRRAMNVDHRADIYSLGVLLYEALCQETPQGIFDPPSVRAGVDARIDDVVAKAMQQAPERRFQSSTEMKAAVEEIRTQPRPATRSATVPPVGEKSRALLYASLGAAVLIAVLAIVFWPKKKPARSLTHTTPATASATPRPATPEPVKIPPAPIATTTPAPPTPTPLPAPTPAPEPRPETPLVADATHGSDLLALVDVARDTVAGEWTRTSNGLRSGAGKWTRITLPAQPAEEYDVHLEFTQPETSDLVTVMLPWEGQAFQWTMNYHGNYAFEQVNGKSFGAGNPTLRQREPFAVGRRYAVTLQVRRQQVSASIDGELLSQFSLPATLELWPDWKMKDTRTLGLGTFTSTLFHRVELRKAGAPPTPTPAPAPGPPKPKAAPEVAAWLDTQVASATAEYQREVIGPFEKSTAALRAQYLAQLTRGRDAASKAGLLDDTLAWQNEQARHEAGQQPHDAADEASDPAALKTLRENWRKAFSKLDAERFAKAKVVHAKLDALLERGQTGYTQRQRLDDALLLKSKREELRAAWLVPAVDFNKPTTTTAAATPKPLGSAMAAPKPASDLLTGREAVIHLRALGAEVNFLTEEGLSSTTNIATPLSVLPKGRLEPTAILFNSGTKPDGSAFTDADFAKLGPMKQLAIFQLSYQNPVPPGTFAFLANAQELGTLTLTLGTLDAATCAPLLGLRKLRALNLTGPSTGSDFSWLGQLAALSDLKLLAISHAETLPPATLARARKLQNANLFFASLTEAHCAALAALPELDNLTLFGRGEGSAAGLRPLEKANSLANLNIAGFPDLAQHLAALGKMRKLKSLVINAQDAPGLAAAAGAPALRNITINGTAGSRGVDDEMLNTVATAFPRLESFNFGDFSTRVVTPDGLRSLAKLPKLNTFQWGKFPLTVEQAAAIAELPAVETLSLAGSEINAGQLTAIAKLKTLTSLDLSHQSLDGTALEVLKTMRNLRDLNLYNTGVKPSDLEALRKALPKCTVRAG
jgi:serine/threonine protein kinase